MLDGIRDHAPFRHRRLRFLPMTSATTPVSAAAKQQHQNDDHEDQFHNKSPLMVMTTNSERLIVNLVPRSDDTRPRHPCSERFLSATTSSQATASPHSTGRINMALPCIRPLSSPFAQGAETFCKFHTGLVT